VEEEQPLWRRLPLTRPVLHPQGAQVACYAQVYAPTRLETEIFHRWEYKDEAGNWREHFRLGYPIAGTNEDGYRGYTQIKSFFSGVWRCSVETERGQVLGREVVYIDTRGEANDLRTRIE
jgi:hypothetical protein